MFIMKVALFTLAILPGFITAAFSQQARVQKFTTQKCGEVILKDVQDKYSVQVYNIEMPDPDAPAEEEKLKGIKGHILRNGSKHTNTNARPSTTVPPPVVNISYISDSLSGIPP